MHVVADRPTIVSALPAPTSTCVRRKTHNACWRISCNPEVRVLEQAGAEAENRRAAPRAANHALARWPSPSADNAAQALRLPRRHDSLLHASIRRAHHHSATPAFPKNDPAPTRERAAASRRRSRRTRRARPPGESLVPARLRFRPMTRRAPCSTRTSASGRSTDSSRVDSLPIRHATTPTVAASVRMAARRDKRWTATALRITTALGPSRWRGGRYA